MIPGEVRAMREIKFRAWDVVAEWWVGTRGTTYNGPGPEDGAVAMTLDGHLRVFRAWHTTDNDGCMTGVQHSEYETGHPIDHDYKPQYVLMQYTGLKDKNGKEIYDGDIIKSSAETVVVEWKGEMWTEEGFVAGFSELFEGANCYEVVGNIYENPELLEKQ